MRIDKELIFSDNQAITGSANSTVVNNIKPGTPINDVYFYVKTTAAFNNLTSLKIALQTSSDNFASDTVELASKTIALADLTTNTEQIKMAVPLEAEQYLRVAYTVTGTAPTTGSVYAAIVPSVQVGF